MIIHLDTAQLWTHITLLWWVSYSNKFFTVICLKYQMIYNVFVWLKVNFVYFLCPNTEWDLYTVLKTLYSYLKLHIYTLSWSSLCLTIFQRLYFIMLYYRFIHWPEWYPSSGLLLFTWIIYNLIFTLISDTVFINGLL